MALNDITLSSGIRASLISLQGVDTLLQRTTERLSSGRKVNNPIDNAQAFFATRDHTDRASDLSVRKEAIGESLQTVETANEGVKGIMALIDQAKGLLASARGGDATTRANLAGQFDEILTQIDELAADSIYRGTNLLDSDDLVVEFNEDGSSDLTITGFDASSTGLSVSAATNSWVADTDIDAAEADLDAALTTLRSEAETLSSRLGVVNTRLEFTTQMISVLQTGADKLTLADPNEEGANMLALQTRQQLGIIAMSLSQQSQQSILRLF
jgi:flagellin-like hook-associated protein FlgL